jgi:hypothetical protein
MANNMKADKLNRRNAAGRIMRERTEEKCYEGGSTVQEERAEGGNLNGRSGG